MQIGGKTKIKKAAQPEYVVQDEADRNAKAWGKYATVHQVQIR